MRAHQALEAASRNCAALWQHLTHLNFKSVLDTPAKYVDLSEKKGFSAYSEGCLLALTHLFDWACLARTCSKFLTFSDACFSLPVGHMLHLFSIISLMLLSDCFACCVVLKWHSASYSQSIFFFFAPLYTLVAPTVIDSKMNQTAVVYIYIIQPHVWRRFFSALHHKLSIKMHPERILKTALRWINGLDVFMHRL